MMEQLACKTFEIRNCLWNSVEKQLSNKENF